MKNKIFKTLLISLILICAFLLFAMVAGCGEDKGTVSEEESFIVGTWVREDNSTVKWEFKNDNTAQKVYYREDGRLSGIGAQVEWTYNEETKSLTFNYIAGSLGKNNVFPIEQTDDNRYFFKDTNASGATAQTFYKE